MAPVPSVLRPRAAARTVDRGMRVLFPHRLDALSRVMDTNTITQWFWLSEACDLVIWSPGVRGYRDIPLDEAAREVDADVVLLPDWHSGVPGVHRTLWRGADRCDVPVVWYIDDQAANLHVREEILRATRPDAVVFQGDTRHLTAYEALREELGWRWLITSRGVDRALFHPPADGAVRDIDILVGGADEPAEVYPVRRTVKRAARSLAGRYTVVEVPHPGYWELGGVHARGQSAYAELLQRSRLATTGTAYGKVSVKYGEVAACAAAGVGDLPAGEPAADRLADAMLVVDPAWDAERVAAEIEALLGDPERLAGTSAAGPRAVDGLDHREHALDYADLFAQVIELARARRASPRRPRPFSAPAPALRVVAAPEPEAVPPVRTDWRSIWRFGPDGASRTRALEAALRGRDEDVTVVALDPDAALELEALVLAEAVRADGRIAVRPGRPALPGEDPIEVPWVLFAAPTATLRQALAAARGRSGVERAVLALAERLGATVLDPGGYVDLSAELMLLDAVLHARPGAGGAALRRRSAALASRARMAGRARTAAEIAGWRACALGEPPAVADHRERAAVAQDPELDTPPAADDAFVVLDPTRDDCVEAIAEHVLRGPSAPPVALGVPMTAGLLPDEAAAALLERLERLGVDVEAGPDLTVLERPLWDGELRWLAERLGRFAPVLAEIA